MENSSLQNNQYPECIQDTLELVLNEDGEILAPNGLRSHFQDPVLARRVRSKDFIVWFGDWIKNEDGVSRATHLDTNEPILFIHRSNIALEQDENLSVEHDKTFGEEHGLLHKAVYFTTADLKEYGKYEYRAFLNLTNPASKWKDINENQDGCLIQGRNKDGREWFHAAVFADDQILLVE